mgnify:CR=1 FL=1
MAVSNGIFSGAIANNVIGGTEQYIANNNAMNNIGYAQQAISKRDYDRMRYEQERHMEEQRRYEQMLGQHRSLWQEEPKQQPEEKPQTDPLGFLKKADTKLLLTQEN